MVKKKIFINMYSMNIGGAERSLIGLLESFDYSKYDVDLFLYRHEGEFMKFIPNEVNLLPEIKEYTTFERPVKDIIKEGYINLACARVIAKLKAKIKNIGLKNEEGTYRYMQYIWKYSINMLSNIDKEYDLGISFLGPHDFLINKVNAKKKIGWVHTDYSTIINADEKIDRMMWGKLDYIVNVSEECEKSFLNVYPEYKKKSLVIENILSNEFVKLQSKEKIKDKYFDDVETKICSVGRLSNQKGFDMAILACKKLLEKGYKFKWYVIGYGQEEKNLKNLISKNNLEDRFVLLGKKINPYPYIYNCDIYCQPSRYEGKSVTVREAQMLSKPVIITDYPTSKSQVNSNYDGIICGLGVDGIVKGIELLLNDTKLKNYISINCSKEDFSNRDEINKLLCII